MGNSMLNKKEIGIDEIDSTRWFFREGYLQLTVKDQRGDAVHCYLERRPSYCDRGHFYVKIDGRLDLDDYDGFPRYFFTAVEADHHVRSFLKWRIWKVSDSERNFSGILYDRA